MNKPTASSLVFSLFTAVAGISAGCASSGGSASGAAPGAPVAIDGARYKLLAAGGSLDGRVVEFVQRGTTLRGCIVALGTNLRGVAGVDMGTPVFSLQEKAPNEYEGSYKAIMADGSMVDKQVAVNFQSDSMNWNLESATWERQSEGNQMSPQEKERCVKQ
ncbi:MAG TPA: hypothetical protein VGF45_01240 [Polyangia bacterium]